MSYPECEKKDLFQEKIRPYAYQFFFTEQDIYQL